MNWTRAIKYIVAFVIFCAAVEMSARIDDWIRYDAPFWGPYKAQRLRTWDSDGIRTNVPGSRFEKWQNDSLGFRGPEIAVAKKNGIRRIVCLGASESYGLYESQGMEWPAQMGAMLDSSRFEVINAATVGLPMTQYIQYFDKYVAKLDPDFAILYIEPASYVAARQRAINNPEKKTSSEVRSLQAGVGSVSIRDRLRTLPKLMIAIKQFFPTSIIAEYDRKDAIKNVEAAERQYLNGHEALDDVPADCLNDYRNDIEAIVEHLREHGVSVILCTYPSLLDENKIDEYFTTYMEGRRFVVELSLQGFARSVHELNSQNRLAADELGVPLVDMESVVPKNKDYFADNVHYTNKGAELVARTMADYISLNFGMEQ